MKCAEAVLLETAIRNAREKILASAAELQGREFDRPRMRLEVAAFQLAKMASRLRQARKTQAGPEVRLRTHDRISEELELIKTELERVGAELTPWPVVIWRRFQKWSAAAGKRHGRAVRLWWKRNRAVLMSRRYQRRG